MTTYDSWKTSYTDASYSEELITEQQEAAFENEVADVGQQLIDGDIDLDLAVDLVALTEALVKGDAEALVKGDAEALKAISEQVKGFIEDKAQQNINDAAEAALNDF